MISRIALVAVLAAATLGTAVPAEAQGRGRGGDRAEVSRKDDNGMRMQGMPRLLGGIELTDAQRTRIRDIHLKYQPRQQALRDTIRANIVAGVRDTTMRVKVQQVALAERNEIRAVLTAEQQKQFDANVAKFDERRKGKMDGGRRDKKKGL